MDKGLFNDRAKITIAAVASLLLVSYSVPALAAGHYSQNVGNKLTRGGLNVVTGWLEFPKQIYAVSRDNNLFIGLTLGAIKGLTGSVLRIAAGVHEAGTFFLPLPPGYGPLIDPEFVWDDWGWEYARKPFGGDDEDI